MDQRVRSLAHLSTTDQQRIQQDVLSKISVSAELVDVELDTPLKTSTATDTESNVLSTILSDFSSAATNTANNRATARIELQAYLKSQVCPMDSNPLLW